MVRRLFLLVGLPLLFLAGCGTSVPQRWQNFKAYYNTYYNAETSFEAGLLKNQNLELNVVEGRPIRMFFPPGQAGYQELQNAIDKGADILRKHESSQYVEPALLLIGKSYFFRKEFFSAQQKFGEIRRVSRDPKLIQQAIFWEARTLFEMELYSQAVDFSEQQLLSVDEWDPRIEAETALILAESHVSLGNFLTAIQLIDPALPQIKDKDLKARGYFLLGQLLQFEGDYALASNAFEQVIRSKREYELIYQSLKQQAISLRESGETAEAEEIFKRLIRDDKNIEVRPELRYELAKTYHKGGEIGESLELYNEILRDQIQPPDKLTQSQTYYGIAEIYRWDYDDFVTASAYYDSASAISLSEQERPPEFNATEMAEIFGEYASIQLEVMEIDSLIDLALLPKVERDSVIEVIRTQRKLVYEEEQRKLAEQQETLIVVDAEAQEEQMIPGLGFLNHLDPRRVSDAKLQFQAIWSDRQLVDNWRRMEAVRTAPVQREKAQQDDSSELTAPEVLTEEVSVEDLTSSRVDSSLFQTQLPAIVEFETTLTVESEKNISLNNQETQLSPFVEDPMDEILGIRLSDIPLDSTALEQAWQQYYARNYELANLLTFSLELPEKAAILYREIADGSKDVQLRTQALYVLTTVLDAVGDMDQANQTAIELISLNPNSVFAERVSEDYGLDSILTLEIEREIELSKINREKVDRAELTDTLSTEFQDSTGLLTDSLLYQADSVSTPKDSIQQISEVDAFLLSIEELPVSLTLVQLLDAISQEEPIKINDIEISLPRIGKQLYILATEETDLEKKPLLYYEVAALFSKIALMSNEDAWDNIYWKIVQKILNEFQTAFPNHPLAGRVQIILEEITPKEIDQDSLMNLTPDSLQSSPMDSLSQSTPDTLLSPNREMLPESDSLRNSEFPQ